MLTIVYFLASYGLAWSLLYAKPLRYPVNKLKQVSFVFEEMLACIVCTGFWCGLLLSFIFYPKLNFIMQLSFAFANVAFTWILANLLDD